MKRNSHASDLQEEVIILCSLLAKNSDTKAEWIVHSDILPKLFHIYRYLNSNYDVKLQQSIHICLYYMTQYDRIKTLMLARMCGAGNIEGAACLLALGTSLTDCGINSALSQATKVRNIYLVHLLLQEAAVSDLKTPLKIGLELGCDEIVGILLKKMNEGIDGGLVNCSSVGLTDLQPEWFEAVMGSSVPSFDSNSMASSRRGEGMADCVEELRELIGTTDESNASTEGQYTLTEEKEFEFNPADKEVEKANRSVKERRPSIKRIRKPRGLSTSRSYSTLSQWFRRNTSLVIGEEVHGKPIAVGLKRRNSEIACAQLSSLNSGGVDFTVTDQQEEMKKRSLHHPHDARIILDKINQQNYPEMEGTQSHTEGDSFLQTNQNASTDKAVFENSATMRPYEGISFSSMPEGIVIGLHRSASSLSMESSCTEFSDMESTLGLDQASQSPTAAVNLQQLDLSNNHIQQIDGLFSVKDETLEKLCHLTRLVLSNNTLEDIPGNFSQCLPNVRVVCLSQNKFENFPCPVLQCLQLEFLDISSNQIVDFQVPEDSAILNQLMEINLSNNVLTQFPVSLFQVATNVRKLNLASNNIGALPEEDVQNLEKIEVLDLSYNRLQRLGDVIFDRLRQLQSLFVQGNQLVELASEESGHGLQKLSTLDASSNLLGKSGGGVPAFVTALRRLKVLRLSGNNLKTFCKPSDLRSSLITDLDLSHNRMTKFDMSGSQMKAYHRLKNVNLSHNNLLTLPGEMGSLSALCSLDISYNKRLSSLPDQMGKLSRLWQLKIEGLKLDIESSVLEGRTRDLIGYLQERLKKSVEYNQLKLMCVGYGGRGKTSLIRGLMRRRKPGNCLPTVGVIVKDWRYWVGPFLMYTLRVWDFAGQEEFYSTHQCFMSDRALYMVVYNLCLGIDELESIKPWLQNIHVRAPFCPVIVVGTHWDRVPEEGRDQLVHDMRCSISQLCDGPGYPDVFAMVEVNSLKDDSRLDRLRSVIRDVITSYKVKGHTLIGYKVPASYIKLEELLMKELSEMRQLFPVINQRRLNAIIDKENINLDKEEIKQAIRFLHSSGIILHYEDTTLKLNDLYFLDPEWLCRMMAQIVTAIRFLHSSGIILHYEDTTLKLNDFYFLDPEWLCRMMAQIVTVREINPCISANGILKKCDVPILFTGKKIGEERKYVFPRSLIPQYLHLLKMFEIALPLDETNLLVPARLSINRPEFELPVKDQTTLIRRIYSVHYIPVGLWSRLVTRILVFVKNTMHETLVYWKKGVYVQHSESAFFLVDSPNRNCVQITVPPTRDGARLLGEIVDHLDLLIEEWYPGLLEVTPSGKCLLSVLVLCIECRSEDPHKFKMDYLVGQSDFTEVVTCPMHVEKVPIRLLIPDVYLTDINDNFHINRRELQLDETMSNILGDGSFGHVYKATYNNMFVAVKKYVSAMDNQGYKALRQEALILSKLHHPSLVEMVGIDAREKILLLELAPLGSLRNMFENGSVVLSKILKHRMALQIAEGLQYLHERMIIYRDMKPDNILVFSVLQSHPVNVKISDYGVARLATPGGLQSPEGTPGYRAPEIINSQQYSLKADMFSYGVTLYELLTNGRHPFGEQGVGYQLDENIAHGMQPRSITDNGGTAWSIMEDVIAKCLSSMPDERPFPNDVTRQLSDIQALCLRQSIIKSKQLHIDAALVMPDAASQFSILVSCGGAKVSELIHVRLSNQQSVQGSLFTMGRVLCMLCVPYTDYLLVGTACGYLHLLHAVTLLPQRQCCNLGDSVLCLTHVKGLIDNGGHIVASTAGGLVAIFTIDRLLDRNMELEVLQLGSVNEPVMCLLPLHSKYSLYIAVASRIYRLQLYPKIVLQTKYFYEMSDSSESGPVSSMIKHKSNLHVIRRWGHRLYKLSLRTPSYLKHTFNTLSNLKKLGANISDPFDARLQSMCLVRPLSTLWLATANGYMLMLNCDNYALLTHISVQDSVIRHLHWMPSQEEGGCVVMCYKTKLGTDTMHTEERDDETHMDMEVCCMSVWDADLPAQMTGLQSYLHKRSTLTNRYT